MTLRTNIVKKLHALQFSDDAAGLKEILKRKDSIWDTKKK